MNLILKFFQIIKNINIPKLKMIKINNQIYKKNKNI